MKALCIRWFQTPFQIALLAAIWLLADLAVRTFHLPLPANLTGMLALLALILLFCMIGVYGLKFSAFDLWMLLVFGIIGFLMRLNGFPIAPFILAIILGDIMEENMRRALQISGGDWMVFVNKPISATLLGLAVFSLVAPVLWRLWRRQRS